VAIELWTPRLLLRTPVREDALTLHDAVFGDADAMSFSSHGPARDVAESRSWLERHLAHLERHDFGMGLMIERVSGQLVGFAGLIHVEFEGADVELGYRLRREAWGRGMATEAGRAWIEYGFESLGLARIVGLVDPANTASRRVLEKCGMRHRGAGRHYGADLLIYAVEGDRERDRHSTAPASAER
jgi:RimJ/RimL family protein N-acetyltransferase